MNSTPPPGLRGQSTARTVLRVLGGVLALAGLYLLVTGIVSFVRETEAMAVDSGPGSLLRFAGGGFLVVIGLGLLNAGFLGAQSRYAAGETMPVVKDSATYLSEGRGIMDVGRTTSDQPADASTAGPYCRSCGVRNDADARFCDGCGTSLS